MYVDNGHEMGAKRLLIVEEHVPFRQALAWVLDRKLGLETVAEAGSLAEARAGVLDGGADIAIVELKLPDGDGVDLIFELDDAGFRVLVLTVNSDPGWHARALAAGAEEVLTKMASLEEIKGAMMRLASSREQSLPSESGGPR